METTGESLRETKIFCWWARERERKKKRNQEHLLAFLAKEFKDFFEFFWRLKPPKT